MKVDIYPSTVSGSIQPPASKSFLHRSIISACLARGHSTINNIILSEDVMATVQAFRDVGVSIEINGDSFDVYSEGIESFSEQVVVNCNESGTTMRFLIPILSNTNFAYFKGKSSLMNRPYDVYESIYKKLGLVFIKESDKIITKGNIISGDYEVRGDISSQFISGLLFVLPLLKGDSTIKIIGNFESKQYVDMTVDILRRFGVNVRKINQTFFIEGNQKYRPIIINAETDYSQMAFFAVLGIVNNNLEITGINYDSFQPDLRILDIIDEMDGEIVKTKNAVLIRKSKILGKQIDVSQCPDIAPILGVLGSVASGVTKITNAKRLVMKESNRLLSTFITLETYGVDVEMKEDSIVIIGGKELHGNVFDSFNDHRIAMTVAIAATIADSKVTILNAEAINKSYPTFYQDLEKLGVRIKYY